MHEAYDHRLGSVFHPVYVSIMYVFDRVWMVAGAKFPNICVGVVEPILLQRAQAPEHQCVIDVVT